MQNVRFTKTSFRSVPWQFKKEWRFVDLVYSGLVADGSTLPLVIITTDPEVPAEIEGDTDAIVLYMPDVKKPSGATTLAVLQQWRDYINPGDHLLFDRGSEFNNHQAAQELEDLHASSHFLPTGGGAFADPNDNSFFAQVEGFYKRQPKRTHANALGPIIKAFYNPTEKHVQDYFRNCLLTGPSPTLAQVRHLVEKSYKAEGARVAEYKSYRDEYRRFELNSRRLSGDVRRLAAPLQLDDAALDGVEWTTYY